MYHGERLVRKAADAYHKRTPQPLHFLLIQEVGQTLRTTRHLGFRHYLRDDVVRFLFLLTGTYPYEHQPHDQKLEYSSCHNL